MYCILSFQLLASEALIPQVEHLSQATQDSGFVVQLRTICDSVLYAYLSKVADTTEKRDYLDLSYTAVQNRELLILGDLDRFLNHLHKLGVLDLHLSDFQPYDLSVLLAATINFPSVWYYLKNFRSDPERSKEFYYDHGVWHAFVATRYIRFCRTPFHSR